MKITLNRIQERATVLLVAVVATLVVTLGGCTIYKIAKMVKRVDGMQDRRFQEETKTNTQIMLPPGTPNSTETIINSIKFEERDVPYEPPGAFADKLSSPQQLINVNITMCLSEDGNVRLTITPLASDWEVRELSDIMPVDEYGFPEFTAASIIDDISVQLQTTTNFVNWDTIITMGLSTNVPKIFQDTVCVGNKFYRTAQY